MTPAEHIDQAEQLIQMALETDDPGATAQRLNLYTAALAHATIAVAVELGAPHPAAASAVPSAG